MQDSCNFKAHQQEWSNSNEHTKWCNGCHSDDHKWIIFKFFLLFLSTRFSPCCSQKIAINFTYHEANHDNIDSKEWCDSTYHTEKLINGLRWHVNDFLSFIDQYLTDFFINLVHGSVSIHLIMNVFRSSFFIENIFCRLKIIFVLVLFDHILKIWSNVRFVCDSILLIISSERLVTCNHTLILQTHVVRIFHINITFTAL